MVFVNELAGIRDIPLWMKHVPADADAMTFVDVVFPAFLFIVGMSIPFAISNREKKGDTFLRMQWHIVWRTLGLLVMGLFMVNGEGGYNEESMGMSIRLWLLLFYVCAILIWKVYGRQKRIWVYLLRATGVAGLCILAAVYRGGAEGTATLTPRWWGILGLIGWAYLFACIFFQLFRKNIVMMLVMICFCIAFYIVGKNPVIIEKEWLRWMASQAGNAAHTSIVLCGMVLSLIYFDESSIKAPGRRVAAAGIFTLLLFAAGYILRPYFGISKIYATPAWCLYSAGICCIVFSALYWIIDIKGIRNWTRFFKPAAINPLLTYIIPGILYALFSVLHISIFPSSLRYGVPGFLWAVFYAIAIMYIAKGLNRLNIKLQL
jgi:predicted acyltransferase